VSEREHGRALLRNRLEDPSPRREGLGLLLASDSLVAAHPEQRTEVARDPAGVVGIGDHAFDARSELPFRLLHRVALEYPDVRLGHLAESPVADALAVGEAAALPPVDEVGILVGDAEELGDEPALADPGYADEGDELRRPLGAGSRERVPKQVELVTAPDERHRGRLLDVEPEAGTRGDGLPDADRLALALGDDRFRLAVFDRLRRRTERSLA